MPTLLPTNLQAGGRGTVIVMACALLTVFVSLATSAYFFSGFLGGGRSVMGVTQALLLCFGIGAAVYAPAGIVFLMARHVRAYGPKLSIGLAGTLISLPLWAYGGAALILRTPYWPYGLISLILGLGLLFWAVSIMHGARAS